MTRKCAIKDCPCKKCLPLYSFPIGDYVRCLKWLRATGQKHLLDLPFVQLGSRCICKCHFGIWAPVVRGKLYAGAYPTHFLPKKQLSNQDLREYCVEQKKLAAFEKLMAENNDNVVNETLTNEATTQLCETNTDESSVIPPPKSSVVDANPTLLMSQEISNQDLRTYYEKLADFGNFDKENNDEDNVNEGNLTNEASSQQCQIDIADTSVITTNNKINIQEHFYDSTALINTTPEQRSIIAKYQQRKPSIATVRASKKSLWTKLKLPNDRIYYHPIMQLVLTKLIEQANTIKKLQNKNRLEKQKLKQLINPKNNKKSRSGHEKN